DDIGPFGGEVAHLGAEHRSPGRRFRGGRPTGHGVDDADGMELIGVVVGGRGEAVALLRDHVDDDGYAVELLGSRQRFLDRGQDVDFEGVARPVTGSMTPTEWN